tara:strand:+ start:913 stop:1296 length:384 start_codon:yes stop_codon:yes gene_type:complete
MALFCFFISFNIFAEWKIIESSVMPSGYPEMDIYIDFDSLEKKNNIIGVWSLFDFNSNRKKHYPTAFYSIKTFQKINCKSKLNQLVQFSVHNGEMGNGEIINSNKNIQSWTQIELGSVNEIIWKKIC